jgi:death on curing protein
LAPSPLSRCDRNTIEQALAAPQAGMFDREFYPDLPSKAAVLLYTLAKSQACPSGNKRIALVLVEAFLALNDAMLGAPEQELTDRILGAAESDRAQRQQVLTELTTWLAQCIAVLEEGGE